MPDLDERTAFRGMVAQFVSGSGDKLRHWATRCDIVSDGCSGFAFARHEIAGPFITPGEACAAFGAAREPSKSWWREHGIIVP